MAQSGYTPIQLYYSTTASSQPTSGNLLNGELAINIADKKLYAKDSGGNVFLLASSGGATGSVESVSVVSANGLAGTVANATTTPAITLSTTITGLLKGNGTAISAAVSGTDYAPATSGTSILYGNGSGGFSNVTIGTGVSFAAGTLSATGSGGTVTSVSFTGGIISVANASTTPALTVAGTSGGIPYFSGATTWASSGLLAANAIMLGGGAAAAPTTTTTGTGVVSALGINVGSSGAFTTNNAANTFTANQTFYQVLYTVNPVTVTSNAGTVPITYRLNNFTNSSAATMTVTLATASAVDGQMSIVRIYDFSAAAQTITWVNTENSTVTAPTTSNGSTTLPLTVGFMYNSQTSKWRCIASA
jgi:hypothetical protein